MPANRLSFAVTAAYRERVRQLHDQSLAVVRLGWRALDLEDLDGSHERWVRSVVPAITAAQLRATRASAGYLTAFLTSELGEPAEATVGGQEYVGQDRSGRSLREAFASPLIGVKAELKRNTPLARSMKVGLDRALLMTGLAVDHAARASLRDGLIADDRVGGYRRAIRGTCGACLGAASRTFGPEETFSVHPGCQCVPEPVVVGVRDRFPRLLGAQVFAAMAPGEQDRAVGPTVAEAVRSSAVSLAALVGHSRQQQGEDFITQAGVSRAT